jgi:acyl-coenzyme A synthetase/AMP-(fatty) acid ligase
MEMAVIGVVSTPSKQFVECVLGCWDRGDSVVLLRGADDTRRMQLTGVLRVVEPPASESGWLSMAPRFRCDDEVAQISFTSGTEGEPKGVLLTHRALHDTVERLNAAMEVDSRIREYVGVPVHYSFGFGRCRAVLAAGGQAYVPSTGFNPAEIRQMLARGEINAISAVPSLWRVLLQGRALSGAEGEKVRWIEIGSQFMSRSEKEEMKRLFPRAVIVQHYGLTEASRSTFLRVDRESGERLDTVGRAYGQTEIDISPAGRIRIKGPHVAKQLLKGGVAVDNVDERGWFETQDLGRLEGGYLHFLGRADDLINCGGVKLSPDALEESLRQRLGVRDGLAVAPIPHPLAGQAILLATVAGKGPAPDQLQATALELLTEHGLKARSVLQIMSVPALPQTDTGKVQRKQLASMYAGQTAAAADSVNASRRTADADAPEPEPEAGHGTTEASIKAIWRDVLGTTQIDVTKNFYDHGGDSLTALTAVIEMERRKVPEVVSKGMLQGLTIREITETIKAPAAARPTEHRLSTPQLEAGMAINMVRGLLVLCVIFAHWSGALFARLPFDVSSLTPYLAPLLGFGTPGFAIVFGVSAGYSMFDIYRSDRARFHRIRGRTVMLLSAGILMTGIVGNLERLVTDQPTTFTDFTNSFYSVLTYYWLMSLTLGLWFRWIAPRANPAIWAVMAGVFSYALHFALFAPLAGRQAEGLAEFALLLVAAKYAYFNLASGTLFGVAIGILLRRSPGADLGRMGLVPAGLTGIVLGLVLSFHMGDAASWLVWPVPTNPIWRRLAYCGAVLLLLWGMLHLARRYNAAPMVGKYPARGLAIVGLLAFPLYVTHGLVIPLKEIIHATTGLTEAHASALSLALFVASTWYLVRKMHNVGFGSYGGLRPTATVRPRGTRPAPTM